MLETDNVEYTNSSLAFKWPTINLFKQHDASFCTWGDATLGRLGCLVYRNNDDLNKYYDNVDPRYNHENIGKSISSIYQVPNSIAPAVCVPCPVVKYPRSRMLDVACGHLWNAVLVDNEIYGLGDLNRYPEIPETKYNKQEVKKGFWSRFSGKSVDTDSKPIDYVEGQADWNERCRVKPLSALSNEKVDFKYLGEGGETHLLALDSKNNVWLWDKTFCGPGLKLGFDFNNSRVEQKQTYSILRIQATQYYNTVLVENYGLVVWFFNKRLQKLPQTISEDKELRLESTYEFIKTVLVPLPNGYGPKDIVDFHSCDKFLVYATTDGKLFAIDTSSSDSVKTTKPVFLSGIWSKLQDLAKENGTINGAKVVKVVGGSKFIVAISSADNTVFSSTFDDGIESLNCFIALPELQDVGCVSVVGGESHFIALLKTGEMMAWGLEKDLCGAFGMGQSVYERNGDGADLFMDKVTKIDTKEKALAIGASGWHSCAILSGS